MFEMIVAGQVSRKQGCCRRANFMRLKETTGTLLSKSKYSRGSLQETENRQAKEPKQA
jgi:hypothetical protein